MANFKFNPLLATVTPSWRAFHAVYHETLDEVPPQDTPLDESQSLSLVFEDPSFYTEDDLNNIENSNRPLQNILKNIVTLKEACEALSSTDIVSSINTWTKAQRPVVVTAKGIAGNLTLDLDEANTINHSLIENVLLTAPLHAVPGQGGDLWFTQSSETKYEVSVDSFWKFPGGLIGTISPELSETGIVSYLVEAAGNFAICFTPVTTPVVCVEEQILYPFVLQKEVGDPGTWESGYFAIDGSSLTLTSTILPWSSGIGTFRIVLFFPDVPTPRTLTINGSTLLISAAGPYEISGPLTSFTFNINYNNVDNVFWYINEIWVNNCSGNILLESFNFRDFSSEECAGIHTKWIPNESNLPDNETFWRDTAPTGWQATPNSLLFPNNTSKVSIKTTLPLADQFGNGTVIVKYTSLNGYAGTTGQFKVVLTGGQYLEEQIWADNTSYSAGDYEANFGVNISLLSGTIEVDVEYPSEDDIIITCVQFVLSR